MDDDEAPRPLGLVPVAGRGTLPFALLEGESLVACASWALGEAEIEAYDFNVPWAMVREAGRPLVVHDPLCPATPPAFLTEVVEVASTSGRVAVGVRPVTDTLKTVDESAEPGRVGGTLDREEHVQVASPLVLPAAVVAELDGLDEATPLAEVVAALAAAGHDVEQVPAPDAARRVADEASLALLSRS